jgi:hypothetical protein
MISAGWRQAAGVLFDLDVGQRLQGFAQAHVVGQNAGQPMGAQKLQPVQALLLVGAQAGLHAGGHGHLGHLGAATQLAAPWSRSACAPSHTAPSPSAAVVRMASRRESFRLSP